MNQNILITVYRDVMLSSPGDIYEHLRGSMLPSSGRKFRQTVFAFKHSLLIRIQGSESLRRPWCESGAVRLLRLWVQNPPEARKSVCCECCTLSGRGLFDGLNTRPEESYRVWCVQWMWSRRPVRGGHDSESGRSAKGEKKFIIKGLNFQTDLCIF